MLKTVTVTLDINVPVLVEAYEKEGWMTAKPLCVETMIKDQFHWVRGSGIKLKSVDKIKNEHKRKK
jgi:hypothetical protein